MSEEEIIKKFISIINSIYIQGYVKDTSGEISDNLKLILDLYQKEKEARKLILFAVENNYISKAKIKAKIQPKLKELEKEIDHEWKKYGNSKELQDMEDMYNFLQELLEE